MKLTRPDLDELNELATKLGMPVNATRAAEILQIIDTHLQGFDAVNEMDIADIESPVYPRQAPYRPAESDNPCNAWAWRTHIAGADSGPLNGRRIALKDTILLAGVPVASGSGVLQSHIADSDATVVQRLLNAGGTILGTAQCEDFCVSGGSHTGIFGPVHNPHRHGHAAGGSSSGCAALVAAGAVDMAIGGDQGGSIRIPAAWCGINGMKPTWNLVPYSGAASIEPSLDHLGPMTLNVADNALFLSVLAGPEECFSPSDNDVRDYHSNIDAGVKGLRIGVLQEGFATSEISPAVIDNVMAAVLRLQAAGAQISYLSIPEHAQYRACNTPIEIEGMFNQVFLANGIGSGEWGIHSGEFTQSLSQWRDNAAQFNPLVQAAIMTGAYVKQHFHGRFYAKAQAIRRCLNAAYERAFQQYDILVMPTLPDVAPALPPADASLADSFKSSSEMVVNTAQFDVTGHPAMSTPCGLVNGLPVGMMLVGRKYQEGIIYRTAMALETAAPWQSC